jgi:hypothetical protein
MESNLASRKKGREQKAENIESSEKVNGRGRKEEGIQRKLSR